MLAVLAYLQWTTVNLISSTDTYGTSLSTLFTRTAPQYNVTIAAALTLPATNPSAVDLATVVTNLWTSPSRIIVFQGSVGLLPPLTAALATAGFRPSDFSWLVSDSATLLPSLMSTLPPTASHRAAEAMLEGILATTPTKYDPTAARALQLQAQWTAAYGNASDLASCPYCYAYHTCMEAQIRGTLALIDRYGDTAVVAARSVRAPLAEFLVPFVSATGPVEYDSRGNRVGTYQVIQYNATTRALPVVATVERDGQVSTADGMDHQQTLSWHAPLVVNEVGWTEPVVWLVVVMMGVTTLAIGGSLALFWRHRKTRRVKSLGFHFSLILGLGLLVSAWGPALYIGTQGAQCRLRQQTNLIGVSLEVATVFVKARRMAKIYDNRVMANNKLLRTRRMLMQIAVVPTIQVLLFAGSIVLSPRIPIPVISSKVVSYACSQPPGAALAIIVGYLINGIGLLANGYLCIKLRRIQSPYNEAAWVGLIVQQRMATTVFGVPFMAFSNLDPHTRFYLEAALSLWPVWIALYGLIIRHIPLVFHDETQHQVDQVSHIGSVTPARALAGGVSSYPMTPSRGRKAPGLTGTYQVRWSNRFFARWQRSTLTLVASEGYLVIDKGDCDPIPDRSGGAATGGDASSATATTSALRSDIRLAVAMRTVAIVIATRPSADDNDAAGLFIALMYPKRTPLMVRFESAADRDAWVKALSGAGALVQPETTTTTSTRSGSRTATSNAPRTGSPMIRRILTSSSQQDKGELDGVADTGTTEVVVTVTVAENHQATNNNNNNNSFAYSDSVEVVASTSTLPEPPTTNAK
ncbi:hypothetical protein BC828DRAFT_125110 [Blastocladiella britannica]|nr:hypothetical protein BC828DRAFT_125110 [Blastocladiella britannica]